MPRIKQPRVVRANARMMCRVGSLFGVASESVRRMCAEAGEATAAAAAVTLALRVRVRFHRWLLVLLLLLPLLPLIQARIRHSDAHVQLQRCWHASQRFTAWSSVARPDDGLAFAGRAVGVANCGRLSHCHSSSSCAAKCDKSRSERRREGQ